MRNLPVKFGEALLPNKNIDLTKWAVVACDQFTSNPAYWERLKSFIGDADSTLNLILPEYLLGADDAEASDRIVRYMQDYLARGVFVSAGEGAIITERTTAYGRTRRGLIVNIDLDAYDYRPGTHPLIRATEGTVTERIPPRVRIRQNCPLELPHIMLLADDPENLLIGSLFSREDKKPLYDFTLNMNGGRARAWLVDTSGAEEALHKLISRSRERLGEEVLFAVGDGNHSLAAAKACHEADPKNERARYCMAEVVSIYDEGIVFEPIHRAVTVENPRNFIDSLLKGVQGPSDGILYTGGERVPYRLPSSAIEGVAAVQSFIDGYLKAYGGSVDYVHGTAELEAAAARGAVGVALNGMDKSDLFGYIVRRGVLPRKTFSMGEGEEKRYYIEARAIK